VDESIDGGWICSGQWLRWRGLEWRQTDGEDELGETEPATKVPVSSCMYDSDLFFFSFLFSLFFLPLFFYRKRDTEKSSHPFSFSFFSKQKKTIVFLKHEEQSSNWPVERHLLV